MSDGDSMRRFGNINLLRALAALAVVYHVVELAHWSSFPDHGPSLAFRIGRIGLDRAIRPRAA